MRTQFLMGDRQRHAEASHILASWVTTLKGSQVTKELLDRSFRPYLLQSGFHLLFDDLEHQVGIGSVYQWVPKKGADADEKPITLLTSDHGFMVSVEIVGAESPQDLIEKYRHPEDGYTLTVYPPAIPEVTMGSWSLCVLLGENVWEEFPGWESVVTNETVCRQLVAICVEQAELLQEYVAGFFNRIAASQNGSREWVFGGLQSIFSSPGMIENGEAPVEYVLDLFRRAFTLIPDTDSYVEIRKWIQANSMRELASSSGGPWFELSQGVQNFGKEQGWDVWSYP